MKVKKNRFGKSQFFISEISFGCGGFWGLPIFPKKKAEELIEFAIGNGINFFDTGPNYSRGNAEKRMGDLLSRHKENIFLATKIGSYLSPTGRRIRDFSPKTIKNGLNNSLRKLKSDKLFLVQYHGPSVNDLGNKYTRDVLLELKNEGKIQHIGISGDGPIIDNAIDMPHIDCIMTTFNVITQNSLKVILKAKKHNKAVLIKSPLSHMAFSKDIYKINSLSKLWYFLRILKNYRHILYKSRKNKFINSVENWKASELALKFILENSNITSSVIGTTKLFHLKENIKTSFRENIPANILDKMTE